MRSEKIKHYVSVLILVVMIAAVAFLILNLRSSDDTHSKEVGKSDVSKKSSLDDALTRQTTIGVNNLKKDTSRKKLSDNIQALTKKKFIGAFVATSGEKIAFAGQYGYANATLKNTFKLNSVFFVGEYQNFLNTAAIFKLIEKGKINSNASLKKYIGVSSNLSVKSFLVNGSDLYLKRQNINRVTANASTRYNLKYLHKYSTKPTGYVSADSLIKAVLISKIMNMSYQRALKALVITPLGLANTRVYTNTATYVNDVKSYKYSTDNGTVLQDTILPMDKTYFATNQLQMSVSDVLISSSKIINNYYFAKKYNVNFEKSINNINGNYKMTTNDFSFYSNVMGQMFSLKAARNGSKMLLTVTNYPNREINIQSESTKLFDILKDD
ncbi:hypothetical protein [Lactobacillus plantarum] [Lactiplantibacillus mudanjiangensis]|uniref:hypothetical protein n=1 Tax=Lactiplantibacillus mudanjiangensis TaxID=1296538 RepID=UPI001014C037|nr:hypothetical protein [Lactiplantibacillus mudanjiangensis]VDG32739.1 hypothetical protein [Lactobacillus plantarum] [Lactiplantibacillus mudanjiangensis]